MDWSILFMGPVGAGKTQAIRSLSSIDVAGTDVRATDETAQLKSHTTVSMDAGVLDLGGGDKVRLLGAPGQDRFDFMWDILLLQAHAVVILLDHSRPDALDDLGHYIEAVNSRSIGRRLPLVVGITHMDMSTDTSLTPYRQRLDSDPPRFARAPVPVFPMDAREMSDVRTAVITVGAMLEMETRFASRV
jgi:uncharacterized protein